MGKRTKQYKKLMRAFEHLGFRQPYQLLMTSDIILDTLKLELMTLFEKTLSCKNLKPMITQCCIRALYDQNKGPNRDPAIAAAIERAKTFERRRCGHLMDEDALPERECMMSVVDPKGNGENKFRYVVATQDELLRERLRSVVPTPLMYVRRSVMILEPMSHASARVRNREERAKFTEGIVRKTHLLKRKREEDDDGDDDKDGSGSESDDGSQAGDDKPAASGSKEDKKKKRKYGQKGPNPLSVKKKKKAADQPKPSKPKPSEPKPSEPTAETSTEPKAKRKRRKKAKTTEGGGERSEGGAAGGAGGGGETEVATAVTAES